MRIKLGLWSFHDRLYAAAPHPFLAVLRHFQVRVSLLEIHHWFRDDAAQVRRLGQLLQVFGWLLEPLVQVVELTAQVVVVVPPDRVVDGGWALRPRAMDAVSQALFARNCVRHILQRTSVFRHVSLRFVLRHGCKLLQVDCTVGGCLHAPWFFYWHVKHREVQLFVVLCLVLYLLELPEWICMRLKSRVGVRYIFNCLSTRHDEAWLRRLHCAIVQLIPRFDVFGSRAFDLWIVQDVLRNSGLVLWYLQKRI